MGNLGEQDGYPVGVSNAHPHFHEPDPVYPDECQACDHNVVDEDGVCGRCGFQHDPEEPE
jgi:hypothetical protein